VSDQKSSKLAGLKSCCAPPFKKRNRRENLLLRTKSEQFCLTNYHHHHHHHHKKSFGKVFWGFGKNLHECIIESMEAICSFYTGFIFEKSTLFVI